MNDKPGLSDVLRNQFQAFGLSLMTGFAVAVFLSLFLLVLPQGSLRDLWPLAAIAFGLWTAISTYQAVRTHYRTKFQAENN